MGATTMQIHILYWHWLVFGMLLVVAELFIPSFTIFWFGLGAVVTAALLFVVPECPFAWQLFAWAVASGLFTLLWFKFLKPRMANRTKAGMAKEAIVGESGQVIKGPADKNRGIVRFTTPLLGADEWPFICNEPVGPGERVFVKDISGNTLIVEKRETMV
jgi:hypothetical protein